MSEAWDRVTDASSQVIAVVDTGVDVTHPDLAGRLVGGYNAVDPAAQTAITDGYGTIVAGIVAADADNARGVAGVAWGARIMPVQVFTRVPNSNQVVAYDSDIAEGVHWAVDNGATIVNLSLGGSGETPLLHEAMQYAADHDVLVVAAAGNTGGGLAQYPAAYPEVLAVGATDHAGEVVDFSTHGDWVDLAAPGFGIVSTYPGSYVIGDGTSFAAPIVTGVAALVESQNPQLSAAQVRDRLLATARDAGPRGIDPFYGHGLLDAARALGAAAVADLPLKPGAGELDDVPLGATAITSSSTGTFAVEGDVDWYRYEAPTQQQLVVTVTPSAFVPSDGQNADPVIEVFNAQFGRISVADGRGPGEKEIATVPVGAGTSYVRISNYNGVADPRTYSVTVGAGAGPVVKADRVALDLPPSRTQGGHWWAEAVAIGDVTGDGLPDVVMTIWDGGPNYVGDNYLLVVPGLPNGGLGGRIIYRQHQTYVRSLTILDLGSDGRLDVAVLGQSGVELFQQQDDGSLASQGFLAAGLLNNELVARVDSADLDNDGDADLILSSRSKGLYLFLHGADGTFTRSDIVATDNGYIFSTGDVDGDGRIDIVMAAGFNARVWHNTAGGWSYTDHAMPTRPDWPAGARPTLEDVGVADVNGDGLLDIFGGVGPWDGLAVFPQNAGSLDPGVTYGTDQQAFAVAAGDLNGDNLADIATAQGGGTGIHFQQADGLLTAESLVPTGDSNYNSTGNNIAIGDLGIDGHDELVVTGVPVAVVRQRVVPDVGDLVGSVWPAGHATGVALNASPQVTFAADVDGSTVDQGTVRLVDGRTGTIVPAIVSYDPGTLTATIDPVEPLHKNKPYRIVVDGLSDAPGHLQTRPFASTFGTVDSTPPALQDVVVRGQRGTTVRAQFTVPAGDLDALIIRAATGTTAPASPTAGMGVYSGVDPNPVIVGLTPGTTYSFAIWYRDASGQLSPPSTVTLHGASLGMELTSGASTVSTTDVLRVGTTLSSPTVPTNGKPVTLVALCRGGATTPQVVAEPITDGGGAVAVDTTQTRPTCAYHWEFEQDGFMGAISSTVTVAATIPVPGNPPPRDR